MYQDYFLKKSDTLKNQNQTCIANVANELQRELDAKIVAKFKQRGQENNKDKMTELLNFDLDRSFVTT